MPVAIRPVTRAASTALLAVALAAAVPAGAATAASLPFSDCGGRTPGKVTAVEVSPHPLRPGRDVDVTLRGTLKRKVTGGTYELRVSYGRAPLLRQDGKLGDVVKLPMPAGDFRLHKRMPVPRQAPPGQYTLRLSAADQNSKQLLCISVPFEVR